MRNTCCFFWVAVLQLFPLMQQTTEHEMREYTAMTEDRRGGTQAVVVRANSVEDARERLVRMGYFRILWVQ